MRSSRIYINFLITIALVLSVILFSSCTNPLSDQEPLNPPPSGDEVSTDNNTSNIDENATGTAGSLEPVFISLELVEIFPREEFMDENGETFYSEPSMLFNASANNPIAASGELSSINLVYQAMVPSGTYTYVQKNPENPDEGYISDENGPVLYSVVDPIEGKLENDIISNDATTQFYFMLPEGAVSVKYWAEVVIKGEEGERSFTSEPIVMYDDLADQGGIIAPDTPAPEPGPS